MLIKNRKTIMLSVCFKFLIMLNILIFDRSERYRKANHLIFNISLSIHNSLQT